MKYSLTLDPEELDVIVRAELKRLLSYVKEDKEDKKLAKALRLVIKAYSI